MSAAAAAAAEYNTVQGRARDGAVAARAVLCVTIRA
jgi:hypothetical protein